MNIPRLLPDRYVIAFFLILSFLAGVPSSVIYAQQQSPDALLQQRLVDTFQLPPLNQSPVTDNNNQIIAQTPISTTSARSTMGDTKDGMGKFVYKQALSREGLPTNSGPWMGVTIITCQSSIELTTINYKNNKAPAADVEGLKKYADEGWPQEAVDQYKSSFGGGKIDKIPFHNTVIYNLNYHASGKNSEKEGKGDWDGLIWRRGDWIFMLNRKVTMERLPGMVVDVQCQPEMRSVPEAMEWAERINEYGEALGMFPSAADENPEPTPTPGNWDLSIEKIVVLQSIERGKFVAGKPGAARVFLKWPDPNVNVFATVDFYVDGNRIEQVPAHPIMVTSNGKNYTGADLKGLKNTANFYIDSSYFTPGQHIFKADVRLGPLTPEQAHIQDPNPNNNQMEYNDNVLNSRSLTLVYISLDPKITDEEYLNYMSESRRFLLDVYPIYAVNILPDYKSRSNWILGSWEPTPMIVQYMETEVRNKMVKDSQGFLIMVPRADYAVGIVPSGTYGLGEFGRSYTWARQDPIVTLDGIQTLAHEIGHHWLGVFADEAVEPSCGINLTGATIYHGQSKILEDVDAPITKKSLGYFNFMGAADACLARSAWVNADTWNKLVRWLAKPNAGALKPGLASPVLRETTDTPGFLVGGTITKEGAVDITTQLWLNAFPSPPRDSDPGGDYRLSALDSAGNVTSWVSLPVNLSERSPYPFLVTLPAAKNTSALKVQFKDQVLSKINRSQNPPKIQIDEPNLEALSTGKVDLSWKADDPDGDVLNYMVLISRDNGKTWNPLKDGLKESHTTISTNGLSGCQSCQIQVVASDGWNSGDSTARVTITLPGKPPLLKVSSPTNGVTIELDTPVTFLATAYDPEEGLLSGDNITWFSNISGQLGSGDRLELPQLAAGAHQITAIAQDSTGAKTDQTVTITVTGGAAPQPEPKIKPDPSNDNTTILIIIGLGVFGVCALAGVLIVVIILSNRRQPVRAPAIYRQNIFRRPPPPEKLEQNRPAANTPRKPPPPEKL